MPEVVDLLLEAVERAESPRARVWSGVASHLRQIAVGAQGLVDDAFAATIPTDPGAPARLLDA